MPPDPRPPEPSVSRGSPCTSSRSSAPDRARTRCRTTAPQRGVRRACVGPGVEELRIAYGFLQAGEATNVYKAEDHERHQAQRDQEKLQDLVVDGGGEAAQDHVPEHYHRRE